MHMNRIANTVAGGVLLALAVAFSASVADAQKRAAGPKPPLGLPPIPWPEDNPYSAEKEELGKLLYFDPRVSSTQTVSCASCHGPDKAFTDRAPVSTGIEGQKGGRSAPTVIN